MSARKLALARGESGSALVELSVIAPLLALLLIGSFEVGRFAQFAIVVGNAARAGVQYGAHDLVTANDNTGMRTAALNDGGNIAGLSVTTASHYCTCADGSASTCQPTDCPASHRLLFVQVDTTGSFPSLFHFPGVPVTFNVNGHAVMRVGQ
ncbi:MAG TPA: TadE/TadG family type IV pilus assembly protein [Candidatus Elarobacter sp.]|jgi:Flp pilus assembly protein TadG|nr:TadE/TadG family type IV pilus assembly protein [Candidatus Elarobacter sp.]